MKLNRSYAKLALLTFASVLILASTSCNKTKKKDEPNKQQEQKDEPKIKDEPKTGKKLVRINDSEKNIFSAQIIPSKFNKGDNTIYLYLLENYEEYITIDFNADKHIGKKIDLTKKEVMNKNSKAYYWAIDYIDATETKVINSWGRPDKEDPVFASGTLEILYNSKTKIYTITLENGKILGTDGIDRTITINYSGTIEEAK